MKYSIVFLLLILVACSDGETPNASPTDVLPTDQPTNDTDKPDTDKPDTDKPDTDKPDTDKPDTDKPDTDKPDTDKPDTDKPDTDKPDTDKPDTDKPDTDKPDTESREPTISLDSHDRVIQMALDMYAGARFKKLLLSIPIAPEEFGPAIESRVIAQVDGFNVEAVHSCDNGGTIEYTYFEDTRVNSTNLIFNNCQINTTVLDGDFAEGNSWRAWSSSRWHKSENGLVVQYTDGFSMNFRGVYLHGCCTDRFNTVSTSYAEDFNLSMDSAANSLAVTNSNAVLDVGVTEFSFAREAYMNGGFTVNSSEFGELTATVVKEFNYESASDITEADSAALASIWTFSTGEVVIQAEDGSEVSLDADTGDQDTVAITLSNDGGRDTFIQPWSLWADTLRAVWIDR